MFSALHMEIREVRQITAGIVQAGISRVQISTALKAGTGVIMHIYYVEGMQQIVFYEQ